MGHWLDLLWIFDRQRDDEEATSERAEEEGKDNNS